MRPTSMSCTSSMTHKASWLSSPKSIGHRARPAPYPRFKARERSMSCVPIRMAYSSGQRCHWPPSMPPMSGYTPTRPWGLPWPFHNKPALSHAASASARVCSTSVRMGRHQMSLRGQVSLLETTRWKSQAERTPSVFPKPVGIRMSRFSQQGLSPSRCCHP